MTQQQMADPREKVWFHSMAWLTPEDNQLAMKEGISMLAELREMEVEDLLDEGFATFSRATPEQQWQAFRAETKMADVWRCLLTENYLKLLNDGIETLPVSDYWRWILLGGGEKAFNRRRREFITHWNRESKEAGRPDLVYSARGGGGNGEDAGVQSQPAEDSESSGY